MDNLEVPEYFICPISLQIMTDPVTATSGITYDRHSIEKWLFNNHSTICPVTKQPLLPDSSAVTPNHTLRRLIQAWCTSTINAPHGIDDYIPAPNTPVTKFCITTLMNRLRDPGSRATTLMKIEALAMESERNRVCMVEAGLAKTIIDFIVACRRRGSTEGLKEALSILYITRVQLSQSRGVLNVNDEVIDSLMWVLECDRFGDDREMKSRAACAMKVVVQKANPGILERLKPEYFRAIPRHLRGGTVGERGTNALLQVLLKACPWGRNRVLMVESGTVFDLVEVELKCPAKKKTTELVLGIIYQLCSCAAGRAQLLSHAAGIAVVTQRILKVSATADDRAVQIIWQISKYSATKGVVEEMARVGTVTNLCLVMVADSGRDVKEKARKILRMHFDAWKDSPCIEMATLTRYTACKCN